MDIPVPKLTTIQSGPLLPIEEAILNQVAVIESWFRKQWHKTPAPITTSVDLRHAGFKLAAVDTNLFPAGFNNLNRDFLPICVQAAQMALGNRCTNILLVPENHTRNQFYLQSLKVLYDILVMAGFNTRIGRFDEQMTQESELFVQDQLLKIYPIQRHESEIKVDRFTPCLVLLNNDLSSGIPSILENIDQPIEPPLELGWSSRYKSTHFNFYQEVTHEFAELIQLDPWLINPLFTSMDNIDFMQQQGLEQLADEVDRLLIQIQAKYEAYNIQEQPFVAIKADNGTYGMSVMMVQNGSQLLNLNRKQRVSMSASKGSRKVTRVLIQEGVYTFESMPSGAVAEPVVYMIGQYVVGGFYRVHQNREKNENLNAPGMNFEPLAFIKACNVPHLTLNQVDESNRFYVYGVIARLAALAAAREKAAIGVKS